MPIPKSRTKGELIPAVIIEFKAMPSFYWSKDQWQEIGGYKGFLKEYRISPVQIKKVHHRLLNPLDFPTKEWGG